MLRNVLLALGILLTGLHASQGTAQTNCETFDLSFEEDTLEPIEISCSEGEPLEALPNFPAFTYGCPDFWVQIFKYTTGSSSSCSGNRPTGLPVNLGTIQLGEFTSTGLTSTNHFNDLGAPLTWTVYPEDVARLQGTVYNNSNVNAFFEVDFYFDLEATGAEWVAGGGNVNDASANPGEVDDWTIWTLRPNISKLVGGGALAGENIHLETSNSLQGYPLQVGVGANGVNAEHGLGGTFDWSASVGGTVYGGLGVSSLEFSACEETSSICASDNDAVVEFFVGNLHDFDQIQGSVDVTDDTPPLLQDVPNDYTLNCPVELEELDALNTVVATDDCSSASLAMTESFVNGDCPNEFTRIRTYTATDGCGLTTQHTQTVQVIDEIDPVLNAPSNAVFSCEVGPNFAPATASDACNGPLAVTEGEQVIEQGDCPGEYTVYRTFATEDLCGNTATGAQTIYVRDQTPPTVALPADVVLPCGSEFVYPAASATDNCTAEEDITIAVFNSLPPTSCPEEYILERRFLATDLCGNSTLEVQTVTVTDNDLPYFTYVPADATYACNEEPVLEDAEADDDCSSFEITTTTDTAFGTCASNYDLIRTFTVVDACGNMADAQQIISIRDTEAPVFETVFDEVVSLECDQIWSPPTLDAQDNCSAVSWEMSIDTVGTPSSGAFQLNVTHTAVDACGNAASNPQTVVFSDTTPPTFQSVPADVTLSCEDDIPFDLAVATDNCTSITLEVSDDLALEVAQGQHLLTRTFTATDAQGNTAQAVQLISIVDATAPTFTFVPADYTAECSEDLTLLDATAQDNCSDVVISVSSVTTPGDGAGNYTVTRTFTATDDAGNSSSATQTISVVDTTAPEFTLVPANYTVECTDDMPMEDATAVDLCSMVTVEVSSVTTPGNATGNYVITRTFTATDDAGNSNTATQTIAVQDTTPPAFASFPEDTVVECSDGLPLMSATATDGCGPVAVTFTDLFTTGNAAGNYTIARTITATDDAGNATTALQNITVQDTTAPEFTFVPTDYTVECTDDMPMDDAMATDNCGEVTVTVSSETTAGDATGNYTITRTFTATDDAGNSSSATQTISVQDTTAPALTVPADYTTECSEGLVLDLAEAIDACGPTSVSVEVETIPGNGAGNYAVIRTFTATDDAGNSTSNTQTITVQDTTPPALNIPEDYTVECSDDIPMDDATATDNCGEITITVTSETTPGDATGNYTIARTFTATDDAGNGTSATQTITIQDTSAPEFSFVPAYYRVECYDERPMDDATASDNCGEVTIEVTNETTAGDAAGNYVVVRTFLASDDAGNSATAVQTITVQDTTAPEFTFVPEDHTVECSDEMPMEDAMASDNCGEVTIDVSSATTAGDAAGNYIVVRTFTATDDAGNSTSAEQTITVQDTTSPEFSFVPEDAIVECTDPWPGDMALAVDACGPVDLQVSTDTLPGICGLLILQRTFTATDDAGNVNEVIQTMTQVDTQGPTFVGLVEEVDLSCTQNFSQIPVPSATDACSEVITLVWNDVEFSGGCTLPISAIVRTYTAVDACNNVSQAEQIILLTDIEAPEWDSLPEDVTIECTDVYELVPPTATDNCATPQITWEVDTVGDVSTGVYDLVFAFEAADDCDNIAEHQHVVHVEDTVSPEWATFPEDYTMACGEALDTTMPTATDACSDLVTVDLVDESFSEGDCLGSGVWTRTFSATDANGNVLESSQLIQVVDTVAPYFTVVPEALTVQCDEALPSVLAEAEDACGTTTVSVSESLLDGSNANNYNVIRTFTATDACGNETDTTQIVTVVDTTPPSFVTTWSDETRQCGEDLSPLPVEAIDACSDSVFVVVNDVMTPGSCEGASTVARTYIISDVSGNADSMLVTVNVVDTLAPVWLFSPEDMTVSCDAALPTDVPEVQDLCSEVTLVLATDTVPGNALGNYDVIQTWTAEDACGNSTVHERVIQVVDTVAPEVVFPANDTVACTDEVPLTTPVISDNCGTTSWTHVDEYTPGPCDGAGTLTRTFAVSDDAGNLSEGVQVISIVDEEAPEFTFVPEPTTWECNAPTLLDSAMATDACSDVTLTAQLDTLSGLGANQWMLLVTWTAEDACGNTAEASQEITVLDQLTPSIAAGPGSASLAWGDALLLDVWESELVYMDSCTQTEDLMVAVQIDTLEALEPCIDEVVLTWTVEDLAGNQEVWVQPVQLFDNDAPVWSAAATDLVLSCDSVWEPVAPAWTDHNEVEVTQTLDTLPGACPAEMTVTWTLMASDVCGNVSEPWIQVVNFVDSLAPDLVSWPEDAVVNAPEDVPVCDVESVVWADNCSDALVDCATDTLEQYCPGSYLLGRTYSVTDACGNASTVQQNILVEDVEAPAFTNWISAETFSCDSTVVAPGAADLSFEDNQSSGSEIVLSSVLIEVLGDECALTEVYTYTLTDGCGNVSEDYVLELSFVDDEAPALQEALESLELFCVSEIPTFDEAALLENVTDNCGTVTAVASDEFEGGECNGPDCVLIRTITMVDNCGNTSSAEQIMVISEPPTVPELPTGFSPNNDSFNDVYQVRNAGPDLGIPPCDWLENTTFTVFDRWGSMVFLSNDISESWDGTNLNGRPLPVGTYFVVFEANGLTYRQTVDLRR